ncbi:unnamed protein product, partial [Iphiclides podalirius]
MVVVMIHTSEIVFISNAFGLSEDLPINGKASSVAAQMALAEFLYSIPRSAPYRSCLSTEKLEILYTYLLGWLSDPKRILASDTKQKNTEILYTVT